MMKEMKRAILFLLVILMCVFSSAASAEAYFVLDLPAALNIIDAAAFEGAASLEKVVGPEGTTEIRDRAFADSSLVEILLPSTIEYIAEDAFDGCEGLVAMAQEGTYAYDWCMEHGFIAESEGETDSFFPGDVVTYKEYTKCPGCRFGIPSAVLQFYRGLDPNSKRAWIVVTGCCGVYYTCTEDAVTLLYRAPEA